MDKIMTILAVVIGWLLGEVTSYSRGLREIHNRLRISAYRCLERLYSIKETTRISNKKRLNDEIYHLGFDI